MKSVRSIELKSARRSRIGRGFTLIELMLVLVILAILATLVVPRFAGQSEKAKQSKAKSDIANLKLAVNMFETTNGRFPTSEEGLNALIERPSGEMPNWSKGLDKLPMDPWGHPYVYRQPGTNDNDFDIFSMGPDGGEGGNDDITS